MRNRGSGIVVAALGWMVCAVPAEPAVLRQVTVETPDPTAYTEQILKMKEALARLELQGEVRVWQARFAGTDSGQVVVSVEYPDMETFVRETAAAMADPEYRALLADLAKLRTLVSDSVFVELGR